jgi:acetate---CoA ligase (ADP-forming)
MSSVIPLLLSPRSIVVVGASNDTAKPGGKVLRNILDHGFKGMLYGVNPKMPMINGVQSYADCNALPEVDLAIIAVAAEYVLEVMETLAYKKNCRAFIIFSAGFGEAGEKGQQLQQYCLDIVNEVNGCLIGPNCIGVITEKYKGVFAGPIPEYDRAGCDCVSASGATMVYLLEMAIPRGLKFRDIFSIGNSVQVGIEDVLEYWDNSFDINKSSKIKLLYMEQIEDPARFLKHARSLVKKGCRIAAIKAGYTEAGSRAASSHTGALAGSDTAVNALFRKAGVFRCYSRIELVYAAAIFSIKQLKGDRIAVITHAGGPGIMLTDILTRGGMKVPQLSGAKAEALLMKLHPGSSVSNPIDFLATGNAEQLGEILDYVENEFEEIDGAVVVFGTTGMWRVDDVYLVLHQKIQSGTKPIFPILPSAIQAAEEVSHFQSKGHVNFTDEVSFGYVLSRINKMHQPFEANELIHIDNEAIKDIIDGAEPGYLDPASVTSLLKASGISTVPEHIVTSKKEAVENAEIMGFPVVMKVIGPLHKSDVGGVITSLQNAAEVSSAFERLMGIENAEAVLIQQQISGIEIYIGAKAEGAFGHQVLCGLGGIFIEVFKDVSCALVPVGREEATNMVKRLRSYPILKGVRGKTGVSESLLIQYIMKLSALIKAAPCIAEMDINPLIGCGDLLVAVDARIRIEKSS